MAKVSAEDIAYEIGLAADELSKPCESNIIPSLADCFREWEVIFGSLLSEIDIDDVNKENTTGVKKRIAALRKWRDRKGREATYKVLVDTLLNRGERYQAENLCHKILADHSMSDKNGTTTTDCDAKESESDIQFRCPCCECSLETYLQEGCPKSSIPYLGMTTLSKEDQENLNFILKKDTKKIIRSFENLSNRICDSLKRQEVTVDNLVRVAVNSDSSLHDKLIKSTSVDRVFTDLAPEMSFFNHETLTRIIDELGDEDDKERSAHYFKDFQEFCKRKVFEIEPGPCTCEQNLSKLKQRKPFAIVLPSGEKRLQNLEDAVSIKETVADVLGVPLATLYLHRIDKGCIILVFSVPDSIAQELFPLPKEKLALLSAKGMVLFVPQDLTYESNQVEDATKPLACSGDMHEVSSEYTPTVPSGTPGELLVRHSLPTSAQLSWTPVPEDKQNDTIIDYTVQVKGPDSTQEIPDSIILSMTRHNQPSGFSINKTRDAIIGRGTYGTVYKARRDADKFPCAAKVLNRALIDPVNPDQTETTIRKIKEECVFLESLRHTNIVQYLGITRDREMRSPVLLMELLPAAESLTTMLVWFRENYNEPLPYFIELNICCDIASAVDYLHSKNVIIRNLSSNNVLVIAKTRAKVADFGMCRINDAINTARSGTTAYMPPEALEKEPVYTPKFDCFSQGVLMIQVCTQKMPDPGNRINMGEASSGTLIPECERRKGHISQIQDRDDLLLIAKDCTKDRADDRPTSSEIHERLATLKTTREYENSLESDCEKLWNDITIHTRFLIDSEKKIKIFIEERHKENFGEKTNVNVIEQFQQVLRNANKICILVVGTSGDGVSTLLNGLFGEKKFRSLENNAYEFTVLESTFRLRSAVDVTVIDCRNLHANLMTIERNVNEVIEKVKPHGIPDLILYSQKMGENIDIVSQTKHKSVIARLTAGFANLDDSRAYKDIWKRCMFVLTFANEYETSLNEQRDKEKRFNRRWDEWKMTLKQALNDSKVYVPMKVCIAGFRESKLHQSNHWLSDIWLAAFLTLPKSGALALLRINAFRFVKAAFSFEDIHPAEQVIVIDQSVPLINNAGAIGGVGAAGTAGAVTGAAIRIVSFGVAAGSGLALGIALGSAVGLGVSSAATAGVKYYKENKNFAKLPPL